MNFFLDHKLDCYILYMQTYIDEYEHFYSEKNPEEMHISISPITFNSEYAKRHEVIVVSKRSFQKLQNISTKRY